MPCRFKISVFLAFLLGYVSQSNSNSDARFFRLERERVSVIPEPYLGIIVGFSLTLVASVVSIILTNYYSERQWVKQRKIDENRRTVEEVYSPLYLILWDMNYDLGYIGGLFQALLKRGISNKTVQTDLVKWARENGKKEKPSQLIKNILRTKLGLIRPIGFQRDIFSLYLSLEHFERRLFDIGRRTFQDEEASILERRLQNYIKVTAYYFHVSSHIMFFLEHLIASEGELPSDLKYKMILDTTLEKKLNELLRLPLDEEWEAESDKILDDALKEISALTKDENKKGNEKT